MVTLSSFLSPAHTELHSTYSTAVSSSKQLPHTLVSPKSPLTSVHKIVAAWKERTPSSGKSSKASSTVSDLSDEGFFSIKRREDPPVDRSLPPIPIEELPKSSNGNSNGSIKIVQSGNSNNGNNSHGNGGSSNKSPFDLAELGPFAQPD